MIALAFGACAAIVIGVMAMAGRPPKKVPDKYEPFGDFEIVTRTQRYRTGWNEGRLGWGTFETYALRFRGKPLTIEGKSGMFGQDTRVYETMNLVVTFADRGPVILVNVGDPNNSSFFYLVREKDGEPSIDYVALDSGGISAIDWLDPPAGGGEEASEHRLRLEGGRYLLLADYYVLDMETLQVHEFKFSPAGSIHDYKSPLGMSPDRASFVRVGFDGDSRPVLLVFDFIDGVSYGVPIDLTIQRFSEMEQIDADWIAYYYHWVPSEDGGHDRFVARDGVTPRPWTGVLSVDPNDGYREYNMQPVSEDLRPVVIDYLRKEMGAELLPRAQYSDVDALKIGDSIVKVSFYNGSVGIWMDRTADTSFVEEVGRRLDDLLATGALDGYFVP